MMISNFAELYAPYSEKASLEETLTWLHNQAKALHIDTNVADAVILEVFMEMAQGKEFAKDGGTTGFTGYPHAELNHYMLRCLREKGLEIQKIKSVAMEARLNEAIIKHIDIINTQYLMDNAPVEILPIVEIPIVQTGFFNLKASPILRWFGYGS